LLVVALAGCFTQQLFRVCCSIAKGKTREAGLLDDDINYKGTSDEVVLQLDIIAILQSSH
jgi:hypothetical protein